MYIAVYGRVDNGSRKHLGNILLDAKGTNSERVYDFSTGTFQGIMDFDYKDVTIGTLNDSRGRQKTAFFLKNFEPINDSNKVSFKIDDLRTIYNTEVVLDFTQEEEPSHAWMDIVNMVNDEVIAQNITDIKVSFTIPIDTTNTKVIADLTGLAPLVNAYEFLKVYLLFYNYYIKASYDVMTDTVMFRFTKNEAVIPIALKDFKHQKTSNDIKANRVRAMISFKAVQDVDAEWEPSDASYYNSVEPSRRGQLVSDDLPDPTGYSHGYALRKTITLEATWENASANEWQNAENSFNKEIKLIGNQTPGTWTYVTDDNLGLAEYRDAPPSGACYVNQNLLIVTPNHTGSAFDKYRCIGYVPATEACPIAAPTVNQAKDAVEFGNYPDGAVVRVYFTLDGQNCGLYRYIKKIGSITEYYRLVNQQIIPRPNLPESVYTLGNNNQIYEGNAPEEFRIVPVITKIFESDYLATAQFNAIYHLLSNRYVENVLLTDESVLTPIDLKSVELYTMMRVKDVDGTIKDLPVTEKIYTYDAYGNASCVLKLGFKKTSFTEILKHDIAPSEEVIKNSNHGTGNTTIIEESSGIPIFDSLEDADSSDIPSGTMAFIVKDTI